MTGEQIILIGLLASAITFGLRVLFTYTKWQPGRVVVNIFLYGLSVGLALLWGNVTIPTWPPFGGDIPVFVAALWQYVNDWIALGAPILGSATLIYNLLYEKVVLPLWERLAK